MQKLLIVVLLFLLPLFTFAEVELDVKIYTGYRISSIGFTPLIGKYAIYCGDQLRGEILKTETVHISIESDSLVLMQSGKRLGKFRKLTISGSGLLNSFIIVPEAGTAPEREYDDDLQLTVVDGALQIINHVDMEHYVAGVVQSEGGGSVKESEFYVVQAICCRTYALNNSRKHIKQGFNLCDSVHCQAYLGRCRNPDIQSAVFQTTGDVIVDEKGHMISAAFHANSGGQTVNSEDIWKMSTPYLKSVDDTFSVRMTQAVWEKSMPTTEWLSYLSSRFSYPVDDPVRKEKALNFNQERRLVFFYDSIRLSDIRKDLALKSTFFSVKEAGDKVLIYGKGYGHGVGLSQQGAIRMAQLGYNYRDIIKFYYRNVEIMSYEQVLINNF